MTISTSSGSRFIVIEGTKNDKTSEFASRLGQCMDSLETRTNHSALRRRLTESIENFSQRHPIHTGWEVAFIVEIWKHRKLKK